MSASQDGAYTPLIPRSISLNSREGDPKAPQIEFTSDVEVDFNRLKLQPKPDSSFSLPMPLYHSGILWSYALNITKKDKGPSEYMLSLASCGPHLKADFKDPESRLRNKPEDLHEPELLRATLTVLNESKEESETFEFTYTIRGTGFVNMLDKQFTEEELCALTVNGSLHARLRITVDCKYFDWEKLVVLREWSKSDEKLANAILRGEKPKGSDWIIETNPVIKDGQVITPASSFHIHKNKLANASNKFKKALSTGRSIPGVIEMVKGEKKCILTTFTPFHARVLIKNIYGVNFNSKYCEASVMQYSRQMTSIHANFSKLLTQRFLAEVVCPELDIVCVAIGSNPKEAKTEGLTNISDPLCFLAELLKIVYSCPYGAMPLAKRMLVGAVADLLHQDDSLDMDILSAVFALFETLDSEDAKLMAQIGISITNFLRRVPQVTKSGVRHKEKPSKKIDPFEFLAKLVQGISEDTQPKAVIPPSRSLLSCEGDQNGDRIQFSRDIQFSLDGEFATMRKSDRIQTLPFPIYFNHILWSFRFQCMKVDDNFYELSLVSIGPHANREKTKRPNPDLNCPKGLEEPRIISGTFTFLGENGKETESVVLLPSFIASTRYAAHQLSRLSVDSYVKIRINLTIDRSYFSLDKIIDLDAKPTVSETVQQQVDMILRGEKPPGSDWEITVPKNHSGKGDASSPPSSYHVHISAVERASPAIKNVIDTGRQFESTIKPLGNSGCLLTKFTHEDMKVVIPLIYGTQVPHPEKKVKELVSKLGMLFKADLLKHFLYPQWERAICKEAMAIDTSHQPNIRCAARLVSLVWDCPFGSMPVAKRVAIGVFADMVHQHMGDFSEFYKLMPNASDGILDNNLEAMLSMTEHKQAVGMVRKTLVSSVAAPTTAVDEDSSELPNNSDDNEHAMKPQDGVCDPMVSPVAKKADEARILFTKDLELSMEDLDKLEVNGPSLSYDPIPLYVNHVLWTFRDCWKNVDDQSYYFSFVNAGPHARARGLEGPNLNVPKNLEAPDVMASIAFFTKEGEKFEAPQFSPHRRALIYSKQQLADLAVDGKLRVRYSLIADRSYFSLDKIIDLDAKPTVLPNTQKLIDMILIGEKPPFSDTRFLSKLVDSDDTFTYHAHKCVTESKFNPQEKREVLLAPNCLHIDMPVTIALLYGGKVPLPLRGQDAFIIVKELERLFKADLLKDFLYPQWERAICKEAMAVDKSSLSSLPTLAHLLSIVWSCPYGSMPVAKRVVIGAMADVIIPHSERGTMDGFGKFWAKEQRVFSPFMNANPNYKSALESMFCHIRNVTAVRQTLLPPTAITRSDRTSGDFVIELEEEEKEEEEWHDAESTDVQAKTSSKWGCSIS